MKCWRFFAISNYPQLRIWLIVKWTHPGGVTFLTTSEEDEPNKLLKI